MITVLTSTYNRAYTLPRLFESLCSQECKHFEWIVIDDGSTDDTPALLADFKKSASFAVRTIQQPNSGKNVAVNAGVLAAAGDWIFIVDNDDALTTDAIATIEEKLLEANSDKLVGLCFRRAHFDGQLIGKSVGPGVLKLTPTKAGALLIGDLAYVFKRDSMLRNPFPVIPGEKYFPELYVWNKIGDQGDIYFHLDKYIYFCNYIPDGITRNFATYLKKNPRGFLLYYISQISRETKIKNKMKRLIRAAQCSLYILREKV
jgi:hypothetical protein